MLLMVLVDTGNGKAMLKCRKVIGGEENPTNGMNSDDVFGSNYYFDEFMSEMDVYVSMAEEKSIFHFCLEVRANEGFCAKFVIPDYFLSYLANNNIYFHVGVNTVCAYINGVN